MYQEIFWKDTESHVFGVKNKWFVSEEFLLREKKKKGNKDTYKYLINCWQKYNSLLKISSSRYIDHFSEFKQNCYS